ncbi:hypothetical protein JQ615_23530 [Bradyrhizobium jicamae]|uniref:Uncharacterized protein n=1 Tax=Bradyrhizobium jicamae TaxID=280332 RepID=A0ABS5FNK4_9BRAD|nr:hypothetical protein [Bradyrhizobium jicamae]MBR0798362.1 hypothetical protein [Bradyrhizobium jicamae]MBR0936278.1 hypothetical protein [Bradyrhizobium jicamae]
MDEASIRRLRSVIPVLNEQRNILVGAGLSFAGHLVDLTIMQLRLNLHDISEEELSEFSNRVSLDIAGSKSSDETPVGR